MTDPTADAAAPGFDSDTPEPPAVPYAPPAFGSPFAPYAAAAAGGDGPWPNRLIWGAATAAVVFLGVWVAGLWEVRLEDPPAGVLAAAPAGTTLGDPALDVLPADDWAAGATLADRGPAAPAEDVAALWGEEPDAPDEPAVADTDEDPFALLADAHPPAAASDAAPPEPAAPAPADDADLWGADPPAVAASAASFDFGDEPAGGAFVAPAPVRTAELPPAAPPVAAAPSVDPFAADGFDPFGDEPAAPAAPAAAGASPVRTADAGPADDFDPFAEPAAAPSATPVTPASAETAAPAVSAADLFAPEPAVAASPAEPVAPAPPTAADPDLLKALDAALAAGEVLQAHAALSRLWWDHPGDRPAVRSRLDGTARQIYFDAASHFMTPRTLAPGETLETVAEELSVPLMYLARVNRVAPAAVAAGDEIKVIRGPFGAAVDLSGPGAGTLTVHAHGYYVRAFRATTEAVKPGEYTVAAKARTGGSVRVLLTGADGTTLTLVGGDPPPGRPGIGLKAGGPHQSGDADQVFDLLERGGSLSVRP